jgi:hypothetical protein
MFKTASLAVAAGALFAGCARIETNHSLYGDVAAKPMKPAAPVVDQPQRPYREIGHVRARASATFAFLRPKSASILSAMRQEAGRIGADAIVLPPGGPVREPGGYYRLVAVEWLQSVPNAPVGPVISAPSRGTVASAPPPAAPIDAGSADGAAPAVPAAGPGDATSAVEMTSQASDGTWKRYVSSDGGKSWVPAPDDEQPPPIR